MKVVKVLGSGCKKCQQTAALIETVAGDLGVEIQLAKVTDAESIMNYGVMSTPAVVVEEKLVHAGSVPTTDLVQSWLTV